MLSSSSEDTTKAIIATYIRLDKDGVAWIDDTKVRVIESGVGQACSWLQPGGNSFSVPASLASPNPCGVRVLLRPPSRV